MALLSNDATNALSPSGGSSSLELAARAGHAAKGAVYAVIGVLAFQLAIGSGGQATGSRGAIQEIAQQPFGQAMLWITAIGLLGYSVWRFYESIADPDNNGSDTGAMIKRIAFFISGLIYGGLGVFAITTATGGSSGQGSGGGSRAQSLSASVMSEPFGRWAILAVGLIVFGVAAYQFYRAYSEKYMEKMAGLKGDTKTWARRLGKFGFSARGVVFLIVGWFLARAALEANAGKVKGLGGALEELASQSYGPWLLGLVAAGLVAYGAFMLFMARYRAISD